MAERTERAALNHLIETCKDAERGFRHVATHAADPVVKGLFLDIAAQRARFAAALLPHAQRKLVIDRRLGIILDREEFGQADFGVAVDQRQQSVAGQVGRVPGDRRLAIARQAARERA